MAQIDKATAEELASKLNACRLTISIVQRMNQENEEASEKEGIKWDSMEPNALLDMVKWTIDSMEEITDCLIMKPGAK